MKLSPFIILTALCLVLSVNESNAQEKKSWRHYFFEYPPLSTPYIQVGYYGEDSKFIKYYFKHHKITDSTFIINIYDKMKGDIINSFKGKYILSKLYPKDTITVLCDSVWGYTTDSAKFCSRSIPIEPVGNYSRPIKIWGEYNFNSFCGSYLVFDGDYIETNLQQFRTTCRYKNGYKNGPFYKQIDSDKFEIGNYINDTINGNWAYYHINEKHDTIPIKTCTYKNGRLDGLYKLYWGNGVVSESRLYDTGWLVGIISYYDEKGKKIHNKKLGEPVPIDDNIYKSLTVCTAAKMDWNKDWQTKLVDNLNSIYIKERDAEFDGEFVFDIDERANTTLIYTTHKIRYNISNEELAEIEIDVTRSIKFNQPAHLNGHYTESIIILRVSYK